MRQTLRMAAKDKMLANSLNQTSPNLLTVPSCVDICVPPLVWTLRLQVLLRMLKSNFLLLKTETVDWLSNRIQVSGMMLYRSASFCTKENSLTTPCRLRYRWVLRSFRLCLGAHLLALVLVRRVTPRARALLPGRLGAFGDPLVGGAAEGIHLCSVHRHYRNNSTLVHVAVRRCRLWAHQFARKTFRLSLLLLLEGSLVSHALEAVCNLAKGYRRR